MNRKATIYSDTVDWVLPPFPVSLPRFLGRWIDPRPASIELAHDTELFPWYK